MLLDHGSLNERDALISQPIRLEIFDRNPDPYSKSGFLPISNEFFTYLGACPGIVAHSMPWIGRTPLPNVVPQLNLKSYNSS
jgi:hypothetical protein